MDTPLTTRRRPYSLTRFSVVNRGACAPTATGSAETAFSGDVSVVMTTAGLWRGFFGRRRFIGPLDCRFHRYVVFLNPEPVAALVHRDDVADGGRVGQDGHRPAGQLEPGVGG